MPGVCEHPECDRKANAFLLSQNAYAGHNELRDTLCYEHYVADRRAEGRIVACEVLKNGVTLRDVIGTDVDRRGQRVEFDADEINVPLLVQCGFVKLLDAPSLAETLAAEEEAMAARLAAIKARRAEAEKEAKAQEKADKAAAKKAEAKADAANANEAEAVAGD